MGDEFKVIVDGIPVVVQTAEAAVAVARAAAHRRMKVLAAPEPQVGAAAIEEVGVDVASGAGASSGPYPATSSEVPPAVRRPVKTHQRVENPDPWTPADAALFLSKFEPDTEAARLLGIFLKPATRNWIGSAAIMKTLALEVRELAAAYGKIAMKARAMGLADPIETRKKWRGEYGAILSESFWRAAKAAP